MTKSRSTQAEVGLASVGKLVLVHNTKHYFYRFHETILLYLRLRQKVTDLLLQCLIAYHSESSTIAAITACRMV